MKYPVAFFFLCYCFCTLNGQTTISGKVQGEAREALLGATVVLMEAEKVIEGTITDNKGVFQVSAVLPERCTLRVSYLGYADQDLVISLTDTELDVENLQIKMEAVETTICIVDVGIGRYNDQDFLPDLVEPITIEEVRKLPATFFDPARLAQSFAGVANANDQANGISVRGNSPNHFKWFLEGVEILNPNHTSNAGTFTDRPSQNAGGVNVLSAQLLSRSQFYKSIYPSTFQNAVGGIMGMSMRNGDQEDRKHLVQVGLIGLEVSSEGPFKKDANAGSYLFNYRFSTVGLLSQLGLDFGGEAIDFQDLAFNFSFPVKKGILKVFGVGGLSNNVFTAPENDEDRMEEKDNTNIDFSGDTGIVGVNYDTYIGSKYRLNITSILSANDASRLSTQAANPNIVLSSDIDQSTMLSTKASLGRRLKQGSWTNGVYLTSQQYNVSSEGDASTLIPDTKGSINRGGLFSELELNWSKVWKLNAGINLGLEDSGLGESDFLIEPRVNISRRIGGGGRIHVASGLYSQSRSPRDIINLVVNQEESLGNIKSWQNSISYVLQQSRYNWKVETFYQELYDMPLDIFNSFNSVDIVEGRNYGVESSFRYNTPESGWTMWLNGTLYQSQFENEQGEWASTRYDGRYIVNALLGKEWVKDNGKSHGIHVRYNLLGGFRETPIDVAASAAAGTTVFDNSLLFSEQQGDYSRVDLSLYRKVERKKVTSTISLDIQNLTNKENESFAFYDAFLGEVVRRNQLGLLPLLNYRLQF